MYSKHEIYYLLLVDSVVIVSRRGVKWSTTYELRTVTISKCYIVIYSDASLLYTRKTMLKLLGP